MALIPPQLKAYARTLKLIALLAVCAGLFYGGWYVRDLQAAQDALDVELEYNKRLGKVIEEHRKAIEAERALRMQYKGQVDRLSAQLRLENGARDATLANIRDSLSASARSGQAGTQVYQMSLPDKDYQLWLQARALAESPSASSSP